MNITWLTQGSFLFEDDNTRIVIDPYMSDFLISHGMTRLVDFPLTFEELKPDVMVCSHDHLDHLDPETVEKIAQMYSECLFAGPQSCCTHFLKLGIDEERIVLLEEGESRKFGELQITAVFADHSDPDAVGLVIENGKKVYLSADSNYDERLVNENTSGCDVVLICINGRMGNMSADDALNVVKQIKPKAAFPMHYGLFAENTADPKPFVDGCKKSGIKSKALEVGISWKIADLLDEKAENVPFRGVLPPVITPLNNDETLDKEAFCKLLDKLIKADCAALFLCGTVGVGPALTDEQYTKVLETAFEVTPEHIPLLAGVMEPATARAIHRLRIAEKIGYKYAVLSAPYFFVPRSDDEILTHFGECAKATSMNIIAYNIPQYTRCSIPIELLLLMHRRGWIGGVKESSGDKEYFKELCLKGFEAGLPVFQGNRPIFSELSECKAAGIVPVPANVDPELYVKAWKEKTETLQQKTDELWNSVVKGSDFLSGSLKKLEDEGIGIGRLPHPLLKKKAK